MKPVPFDLVSVKTTILEFEKNLEFRMQHQSMHRGFITSEAFIKSALHEFFLKKKGRRSQYLLYRIRQRIQQYIDKTRVEVEMWDDTHQEIRPVVFKISESERIALANQVDAYYKKRGWTRISKGPDGLTPYTQNHLKHLLKPLYLIAADRACIESNLSYQAPMGTVFKFIETVYAKTTQ